MAVLSKIRNHSETKNKIKDQIKPCDSYCFLGKEGSRWTRYKSFPLKTGTGIRSRLLSGINIQTQKEANYQTHLIPESLNLILYILFLIHKCRCFNIIIFNERADWKREFIFQFLLSCPKVTPIPLISQVTIKPKARKLTNTLRP